jgi:hypothetical protein
MLKGEERYVFTDEQQVVPRLRLGFVLKGEERYVFTDA